MDQKNQPLLPQVIILLGAPGSGKGTQAKELGKTLRIPHISTGDLFRENLANETPLGKKVKSYLESGNLVPDSLVLDMLFDRIKQPDCINGYLLDGSPRTVGQAEAIDAQLADRAQIIALNLDVDDNQVIRRITGRLTCKTCGSLHNKYYAAPKVEGKCNQCGGELGQRSDDKLEIVEERLRVYHKQTAPLIDHYKNKGLLRSVNGDRDPKVVLAELIEILQ